ncbi:acyltransferase [Mycobacterium sp. NS-7484]|uniref:wax ester/triacylglycerol synthase family O-acyltransferase n=1 Tax=Mycobacterium sp. NS-7484 TaxID=1834161 RepID=UPI00096F1FBD|nr:wax ester/triacylglycerol synthase family O-acyltransferase [Mycobacterium sp. NS-7484]OMB97150.1 acyltransferase [Mycobacterium sp. NS-7484]
MERLTGHDASFLYMETPTHFHHSTGLLILDPSPMSGGYSFAAIRQWLAERVADIPPYTEKAYNPWYNLGQPVWVADESFDLDRHLFHRSLPAPGDRDQLADLVGKIAAQPLDPTRPLWEMWVIDGLADGTVAVVVKRHNASLDGVRGNSHMGQLCGNEATELSVLRMAGPARPAAIAGSGLREFAAKPVKLGRMIGKSLIAKVTRSTPQIPEGVPHSLSAPRTSFNTTLTANRNVAWATFAMSDVQEVKRKLGVTLNDVVLALTSTTLRNYLLSRNELPETPLQAFVPVAVHHKPGQHGRNQTTGLLTSLQTGMSDPVDRALAITAVTEAAKQHAEALGPSLFHDWFEFAARYWGTFLRLYSRFRLADRHTVMQNVVVSNMGGRHRDLYFGGARVIDFYPFGSLFDGSALFVAVASIEDRLNIGLLGCPEIVPELDGIAAGYVAAFDELRDALDQRAELTANSEGSERRDIAN